MATSDPSSILWDELETGRKYLTNNDHTFSVEFTFKDGTIVEEIGDLNTITEVWANAEAAGAIVSKPLCVSRERLA